MANLLVELGCEDGRRDATKIILECAAQCMEVKERVHIRQVRVRGVSGQAVLNALNLGAKEATRVSVNV